MRVSLRICVSEICVPHTLRSNYDEAWEGRNVLKGKAAVRNRTAQIEGIEDRLKLINCLFKGLTTWLC